MCLPSGLVTFIAKMSTIYVVSFSLYCVYQYVESGFAKQISQTLPILAIALIFLLTGICSCVGLNKKYLVICFLTILVAMVALPLSAFLNSLSFNYFDMSQSCEALKKSNPIYELFIDKNVEQYFKQTSTLLCSKNCPCKWTNNTQILEKHPKKFVVDQINGAKNALECPGYLDDIQFEIEKKQYLQEIIRLEYYGCSGYCKKNDFYSITDINQGEPKFNCFDVSRQIHRLSNNTLFIGLYFLSWALLILILTTCCSFYHFRKEVAEKEEMMNQVQNFKKQFGKSQNKSDTKSSSNNDDEGEDEEEETEKEGNKEENKKEEEEQNNEKEEKKIEQTIEEKQPVDKKND